MYESATLPWIGQEVRPAEKSGRGSPRFISRSGFGMYSLFAMTRTLHPLRGVCKGVSGVGSQRASYPEASSMYAFIVR
jgi:hypothetical protein